MRILLIEDSTSLRKSISLGLRKAGYKVDVTGDGNEGLWFIESNEYDVVILDLMLPGLDGISILKQVRKKDNPVHVLILSAKDTVEDRINGLETGADDYLIKPFAFEELLARIQSLVRRSYKAKSYIIAVGDLEIDINKRCVSRNNKVIDLPPREYSLLEFLAVNRGKIVSRTQIEEHIYDDKADILSNVVDAAVCSLRSKIDKSGKTVKQREGSLIKTRRGFGYTIE